MARELKSEKYQKVDDRLRLAQRWRNDEGYDEKWRRMIDLYRGKTFWGDTHSWPRTSEDRISVNLAFSTINVIGPAVSVNHPKITISANRESDADRAVFVEAVINYLWRHFDYRKPFRRSVKDFLIIGHAWMKVGWKFVEEERRLTGYEIDNEVARSIQEIDEFAMENPALAGDLPSDEDVISSVPISEMVVLEDQPFVERISPFDMFVDPEATCLDDAKWIAQRIVRPLSEVRKDKRYKGAVRRSLEPDAGLRTRWSNDTEREEYSNDVDRVTIYEYYDLEAGTHS